MYDWKAEHDKAVAERDRLLAIAAERGLGDAWARERERNEYFDGEVEIETGALRAFLAKHVPKCDRCAGTGRFVTYVENGVPKGPGGICFRCGGKGYQTDADKRRNWGYDMNRPV